MAVRIGLGRGEYCIVLERCPRRGSALQHRGQLRTECGDLTPRTTDHRRPENRGRRLAKRTGLHPLSVALDPALAQRQPHGHR